MKILTIDTSSNICGVSILEDFDLLCKLDTETKQSHSENLMPMIKQAFNQTNLNLQDMDLIVCDKGPGSFTGLRIGIATAKAFHDSLGIPCVGISSLEVFAYQLKEKKPETRYVCSILDAKNNNCYFAFYSFSEQGIEILIEPQAETIESSLAILQSYCEDNYLINPDITFVGDGATNYLATIIETFIDSSFASPDINTLDSYSLGIAGLNAYNSGLSEEELLPLYLKKPQAQRQLEEKNTKESQS